MDGHPHPHAHKTMSPVSVANTMLVEVVPAPLWKAVISGPSLQSSSICTAAARSRPTSFPPLMRTIW
ncbi:MAG: hypothetical protein VW931_02180 [Alphaproteobacteria bacterium]